MSNLNTHGINSFESARAFLGNKSSRTLCFATTVSHEAVAPGEIALVIRHHGSDIIRYYGDGRVEIRNAGYLTATTTDRLHRMTPDSVRVSRAKGGRVTSPLYNGRQPYSFERVF